MKATELRIGNLVNYKIIDDLDPRKEWYEVTKIDIDDLRVLQVKDEMNKDYQPIPLTEEWLVKFGFKERKETDNFSYFGISKNPITHDWMLCLKKHRDEKWFFFQNAHHNIQYVHQLQNLYFALTGEELTL